MNDHFNLNRKVSENEFFLDYYEYNIKSEDGALVPILPSNTLESNECNYKNGCELNDSTSLEEEFEIDLARCLMSFFNRNEQNVVSNTNSHDTWSNK
jgi:hypothetical protein